MKYFKFIRNDVSLGILFKKDEVYKSSKEDKGMRWIGDIPVWKSSMVEVGEDEWIKNGVSLEKKSRTSSKYAKKIVSKTRRRSTTKA
jgi:hypothetical protein